MTNEYFGCKSPANDYLYFLKLIINNDNNNNLQK